MTPLSLANPPINEVICGFIFQSDIGLSPTEVGLYWASRLGDFPKHELKDIVVEPGGGSGIYLGLPPLRTWLVNEDGTRLLQVQSDRAFVNWRRQTDDDAYPRFTTVTQGGEPLLPYALRQIKSLQEFCSQRGRRFEVDSIELSKVDIIRRGQHWDSYEELTKMLPVLGGPLPISDGRDILLRFESKLAHGEKLSITVASGEHKPSRQPIVRLEVRVRKKIESIKDTLFDAFSTLDSEVDSTFFSLLTPTALERFGAKEGG